MLVLLASARSADSTPRLDKGKSLQAIKGFARRASTETRRSRTRWLPHRGRRNCKYLCFCSQPNNSRPSTQAPRRLASITVSCSCKSHVAATTFDTTASLAAVELEPAAPEDITTAATAAVDCSWGSDTCTYPRTVQRHFLTGRRSSACSKRWQLRHALSLYSSQLATRSRSVNKDVHIVALQTLVLALCWADCSE